MPLKDTLEKLKSVHKRIRGLGDLIHVAALPIAKALNLDCVDKETGELKPESECAKRQEQANQILPFTGGKNTQK